MPDDAASRLPTFEDVRAAAGRIAGHARRTPLLADTPLDALTGGRILLKVETLQHTGSFKFRGAYNRLVQLDTKQRRAGVVAFSSGNHAQGVAAAARLLGIPATIVMPSDAPRVKMQNTLALGASVIEYDRERESREEIAASLATERGAVLVPSFDDPHIIAGQGTVGLEIVEQAIELGMHPDDVVVCCSGGGLVAGTALAVVGRGRPGRWHRPQRMPSTSTSNISVVFGGITPGTPRAPYAAVAGQVSCALPPVFTFCMPSVQHGMTRFSAKLAGWPRLCELSNSVPSSSVPR